MIYIINYVYTKKHWLTVMISWEKQKTKTTLLPKTKRRKKNKISNYKNRNHPHCWKSFKQHDKCLKLIYDTNKSCRFFLLLSIFSFQVNKFRNKIICWSSNVYIYKLGRLVIRYGIFAYTQALRTHDSWLLSILLICTFSHRLTFYIVWSIFAKMHII